MLITSKADIQAKRYFKIEKLSVPEWDLDVFVRSMNVGQAQEFWSLLKVNDIIPIAHLACWGLCKDDGTRIYTDKDISQLNQEDGEVIARIANKVLQLSGIGSINEDALGDAKKK